MTTKSGQMNALSDCHKGQLARTTPGRIQRSRGRLCRSSTGEVAARRDRLVTVPPCGDGDRRSAIGGRVATESGGKPCNWAVLRSELAGCPDARVCGAATRAGLAGSDAGGSGRSRRDRGGEVCSLVVPRFGCICRCRAMGRARPCPSSLDIGACSCQGSYCEGSDDSQPLCGRLGWVERIANPSLLGSEGDVETCEQSEREWPILSNLNTGRLSWSGLLRSILRWRTDDPQVAGG